MSGSDIYHRIARGVQELVGESIVGVNSYDAATDAITTRAVLGLGLVGSTLTSLLGRDVHGWSAKITPNALRRLSSGSLHRVDGGAHELFLGQIPVGVARWLERVANVSAIYAAGLVHDGALLGNVTVALREPAAELAHAAEIGHILQAYSRELRTGADGA